MWAANTWYCKFVLIIMLNYTLIMLMQAKLFRTHVEGDRLPKQNSFYYSPERKTFETNNMCHEVPKIVCF